MRSLESYRGQDFIGVEGLGSVAASLINRYSNEPERGNVKLNITPRIVRHYIGEGLLGEPSGQAGASIVFNYGNLLRLLAVKKLLAEHWSVIKIREFMNSLDITALEHLVNSDAPSPTPVSERSMQRRADDKLTHERGANFRQAQPLKPDAAPPRAPLFGTSPLPAQPPPLASLAVESARRAERSSGEWIEIATGLEIRLRRSFRPPADDKERARLKARIWAVINREESKE